MTVLEDRENPATGFIAAGAVAGGEPLVQVTRQDGSVLARFEAFDPSFRGGVRAAVGNVDGNPNVVDVVAVPGPGGGPIIRVFAVDTTTGQVTPEASFLAFDADFRDGLRVAVGQIGSPSSGTLAADTPQDIIVGADAGGGPRVSVFQLQNGTGVQLPGPLGNFFAFDPDFRGGVRVAAGNVDANLVDGDELITGAGPGGGPQVRVFGADGTAIQSFFALPPGSIGGVNVAYNPTSGQAFTDGSAVDFSQRDTFLNSASQVNVQSTQSTTVLGLQTTNLTTQTGSTSSGLLGVQSVTPSLAGLSSDSSFGFQTAAPLQTTAFGLASNTAPLQTTSFGNPSLGFQSSTSVQGDPFGNQTFGLPNTTGLPNQTSNSGNSLTF